MTTAAEKLFNVSGESGDENELPHCALVSIQPAAKLSGVVVSWCHLIININILQANYILVCLPRKLACPLCRGLLEKCVNERDKKMKLAISFCLELNLSKENLQARQPSRM